VVGSGCELSCRRTATPSRVVTEITPRSRMPRRRRARRGAARWLARDKARLEMLQEAGFALPLVREELWIPPAGDGLQASHWEAACPTDLRGTPCQRRQRGHRTTPFQGICTGIANCRWSLGEPRPLKSFFFYRKRCISLRPPRSLLFPSPSVAFSLTAGKRNNEKALPVFPIIASLNERPDGIN